MADKDDEETQETEEVSEQEATEESERRVKKAVDEVDAESEDEDDDEELGDKGKRALDRMKEQRRQLRQELADARTRVKKYEDANKSESQRLTDSASEEKLRADAAENKLMRLEVAMEKGLTPKQAARLAGSTKEELEEDADELLKLFKQQNGKSVDSKPKERLSGGSDPEEKTEESNPSKLAASIPRNRF